MRPSASATKRIAAPSSSTEHHHHTSLRSPYPSAPIQATPDFNPNAYFVTSPRVGRETSISSSTPSE